MQCRITGCAGQGTMEVVVFFKAERMGVPETLSKILGPYCEECAQIALDTLSKAGLPQDSFLKMTEAMVAAGYSVSTIDILYSARPYGSTASNTAYVPAPGKCHHPECKAAATVKPVLIIPCKPVGVSYAEGNGFCADHIQPRLNILSMDAGTLRLIVYRLVQRGLKPMIDRVRVEARLTEWKPTDDSPGNPSAVIITTDIEQEHAQAVRKANNARNN